jgi:hypothetical protein
MEKSSAALLEEYEGLCMDAGAGNADPFSRMSDKDARRLEVVKAELLRRLAERST